MVVVLPQAPLLVPQLATGATAETADLRSACRAAAARMGATVSEWVAVGADGGGRRTVPADTRGSFVGFGADVVVGLGPDATGPVDAELPLPLLIAGWAAAGTGARLRGELVAPDATPAECAALGERLAAEPVGLLVVGDGSAKHTLKAPGHLDERSGPFDDAVANALRTADPAGLAALDPGLARELWAIGRAPWQVLAGATAGHDWTGELLYTGAPYGVGYHVAVWSR